jgi:hypothetical protein
MTEFSKDDLMRAAVYETVKWWFAFDGILTYQIEQQSGRITMQQVRAVANTYNFGRNLPPEDARVQHVVNSVNLFSGKVYTSFDSRAAEIEKTITALHSELKGSSPNNKAFRIVSGMTKLTWFVAPENWTPFDRLACAALNIRTVDSIKRMRKFYKKLDAIGYAEKSAQIRAIAQNTPFSAISGERILDKFLMFNGEDEWTAATVPSALAFPMALPAEWRNALKTFSDSILADDSCHLALEETA